MSAARAGRAGPRRQRGIATLLIVLMLGLALGTSTLLSWNSLRGSQERMLSVHSTAPAQASAWRGVELVRRWLQDVEPDVLEGWAKGGQAVPVTFAAPEGAPGISARITGVEAASATAWRVTAQVGGVAAAGGPAQTRATVEVVYEIAPAAAGGGGGDTPDTATVSAISIYRDLVMRGSITVAGGEGAVFNVDGNVDLQSASITGIDTIRATGDVDIGSNIRVGTVHSNGDVTLHGSASVAQIRARGDVTILGGARPVSVRANGLVTLRGGSGDVVESRGGVSVPAGGVTITTVRTMGDVLWSGTGGGAGSIEANGRVEYAGGNRPTAIRARGRVALSGGGAATVASNGAITHAANSEPSSLQAIGDVTLSKAGARQVRTRGNTRVQGYGGIAALEGQGNLYVAGWVTVTGTIGGTLTKAEQWNTGVKVKVVPGYRVDVAEVPAITVEEVPELVMTRPRIDAYALRAAANYVFEIAGNAPRVTVANVAGVPAGSYVLGIRQEGSQRYPEWLCRPADLSNGVCRAPVATLCQGYSRYNGCLTYANGTWTLNGTSLARGVAWFDGNLAVGNGTYVNTFIATGNIATSGSHRTLAPNYAGYAAVCANATPPGTQLAANRDFAALVPTSLCDVQAGAMVPTALANAAYVAGGYRAGGGFVGGNIDLGASTRADGSVLAGNLITTGGSTTVSGALLAAGQGSDGAAAQMGGSTSLDLDTGAAGYDPGAVPCEMAECESDDTPAGEASAQILWTRYR